MTIRDWCLQSLFVHSLRSSSERLMPDGTLTICFEIKIFPSLATVSHRIVQENVVPTNPAPAAFPAAVAPSRKNFFEGMVDNFVDLKLSSVLIVFKDGEQKCHAFPLAARNAL
jgi:hypothetical protein